jgi:hypothetical protein
VIRVCAWCRAILGYKCDHCGGDLIPADHVYLGRGKKLKHEPVLICPAAPQPYVFDLDTHLAVTHGICDSCAALSPSEKDAMIQKNRARFISSQAKREQTPKAAVETVPDAAAETALTKKGSHGGAKEGTPSPKSDDEGETT